MENNNQLLLEQIEGFNTIFNWDEDALNFKKSFQEALAEARKNESESQRASILNWLEEQYGVFKKDNLRFIVFPGVDNKNKYTPFYKFARSVYEDANPKWMSELNTKPWQILDMAIAQLENNLNAEYRGELDIFWSERFYKKYSESNDYYFDEVNEFVELLNLVEGVDDYFALDVIEKYYFNGGYPNGYSELSENLYISRVSNQEERLSYNAAWNKLSIDLTEQISDKMVEIERLISSKFSSKDLATILEIEDSILHSFNNWYQKLEKKSI